MGSQFYLHCVWLKVLDCLSGLEIAWKRGWVCPLVPVLVKRAEKHIAHTQRVIYSPWLWSFRWRLAGFSAFKHLLLLFTQSWVGERGGFFTTCSQHCFVWAHGEQNISRPNNPAVLIHPTPYSILSSKTCLFTWLISIQSCSVRLVSMGKPDFIPQLWKPPGD